MGIKLIFKNFKNKTNFKKKKGLLKYLKKLKNSGQFQFLDSFKKTYKYTYNNKLIPSGFGELASGLFGEGRMAEPLEIVEHITSDLSKDLPLSGIKVLVTAGPTYEAIDPVRYIGNRSSGKMGIEIALECANNGASVFLVLGPTNLECKHPNIITHRIESAKEMYDVVKKHFVNSKISIFTAAVSDYTSEFISENKIKKSQKRMSISLVKTVDILSEMSLSKSDKQFVVGFALETENEIENAKEKLKRKDLDMIVLNSLNNEGSGFQSDTNKITIIEKGNKIIDFDLKNKSEVAKDIVARIIELS